MGPSRDRAMYRSVGSRCGMVGLLFGPQVTRGIAYSAAQGHGGQWGDHVGVRNWEADQAVALDKGDGEKGR